MSFNDALMLKLNRIGEKKAMSVEHWSMVVAGEDRSIWNSTSINPNSSVNNSTCTDLGSKSDLRGYRSAAKRHSHGSVCLLEYDTVCSDRNVPSFQIYLCLRRQVRIRNLMTKAGRLSKISVNFHQTTRYHFR